MKSTKKKPAMKKAMKKVMKAKQKTVASGSRAKSLVFKGSRVKTSGGLKKSDLTRNKRGKIVSVKLQKNGKKAFAGIRAWLEACKKARAALKVKGFVAIKKRSPLYKKAKEFYGK